MKVEDREALLDRLIDLVAVTRLGGGRPGVLPFVDEDGAFGFHCGEGDDAAVTASCATSMFEKGGFAPNARKDADYTMYRNMRPGSEMEASDVSRVVRDEDGEFRFECRLPGLPAETVQAMVDQMFIDARAFRLKQDKFELQKHEKKREDRRRDRVSEVFSAAADRDFVGVYLEQRVEQAFPGAFADIEMEPPKQGFTDQRPQFNVSTDVGNSDFDTQSGFRWKLSEIFDSAGAVGSFSPATGLFGFSVTGTPARLALDILDHDPQGAAGAAEKLAAQMGADEAAAFRDKFAAETGKRAAEQAARQGTGTAIKVGGPLRLKHA